MIFIIADCFFHFVWWTYTCNCFLFSGGFFFHKENYSFSCMKEKYSSEGMKYCKKLTWSIWQTNTCLFNKAVFRGNSFFKTLLKFTLSSFACFKKFNFFFLAGSKNGVSYSEDFRIWSLCANNTKFPWKIFEGCRMSWSR